MREALPVKRTFNGIDGDKGISATALYDFLKIYCDPDDRDYFASAPIEVAFTLDGVKRYVKITHAGFACVDPGLMLEGEVIF